MASEHQPARALFKRLANRLFFRDDWLRWMTPLRVAISNALMASRRLLTVVSSDGEPSIAVRAAVTRVRTYDRTDRLRAARRRCTRIDLAAGIGDLSSIGYISVNRIGGSDSFDFTRDGVGGPRSFPRTRALQREERPSRGAASVTRFSWCASPMKRLVQPRDA